MTSEQFKLITPNAPIEWLHALILEMEKAEINTPLRQSAFIAQVAHESQGLTKFEENLNYSAERLVIVFPRKFTVETARGYARQPERIANLVYSNRLGNGDEASGDGWKYHGRSPIMLTFFSNYQRCGEEINEPILDNPDLLLSPEIGCKVATWFWNDKDLNILADNQNFDAITRKINGGLNGKDDRDQYYAKAKRVLL